MGGCLWGMRKEKARRGRQGVNAVEMERGDVYTIRERARGMEGINAEGLMRI